MSRPLTAAPASCTTLHAHSAARSDGFWRAVTAAAKYPALSFCSVVVMAFGTKLLQPLPPIAAFSAYIMLTTIVGFMFWLFCGQSAFFVKSSSQGTEFAFAFSSSNSAMEHLPGFGPSPPALTCGPPVPSSSVDAGERASFGALRLRHWHCRSSLGRGRGRGVSEKLSALKNKRAVYLFVLLQKR